MFVNFSVILCGTGHITPGPQPKGPGVKQDITQSKAFHPHLSIKFPCNGAPRAPYTTFLVNYFNFQEIKAFPLFPL